MITKKDILHLAKLAKLRLTDAEIEKYMTQLGETVKYIDNLNELKTKGVEPTSQVTNLRNVFFKDGEENKRKLSKQDALKNAKNTKKEFFVVKRIL